MIDHPAEFHVPHMKQLWKTVFGDTDRYIDLFFQKAYHPSRCLVADSASGILGMVYWLPCTLAEQRYAYIYALAVAPEHRGKGLGRSIMEQAHRLLENEGWAGVILLPQEEGLRSMYQKLGYRTTCSCEETVVTSGNLPLILEQISPEEYAALRSAYLPEGGVSQKEPFLSLLEEDFCFYRGEGFLLTARKEADHLFVPELLGDAAAPGILASLGRPWGRFRRPGKTHPGAMYKALSPSAQVPAYFAFELM